MSKLIEDWTSSFHCNEKLVSWKMANTLEEMLPTQVHEIILLFIGTDRSTGDSFGPLTGTILSSKPINHLNVYGTLKDPIHARNLDSYIEYINTEHANPFIIAIDAALGKSDQVKTVKISDGGLEPGAAFNKQLPCIGDINIKGFVNTGGFLQLAVLQSTRLYDIMEMAETLAQSFTLLDLRLSKK
ncbi:spore protease YyaC [Alkalibacillus haloalkaliphilus]|uniref:spore protease YyaC n=1 Tax=Alkalibacillus haloalkaliphilus TaxID=94136 RepID=UPI002935441F|nr:spore protease YyaC [Alkalibacillus haloalkaliphilus]MDV2581598.1 spore protease YyaC [Alkalibacillus haloalkaliphilus]